MRDRARLDQCERTAPDEVDSLEYCTFEFLGRYDRPAVDMSADNYPCIFSTTRSDSRRVHSLFPYKISGKADDGGQQEHKVEDRIGPKSGNDTLIFC